MYKRRLWTHWLLGLVVILALAAAAAWLTSQSRSGRAIHFWMDDATGLEPGTVVNLSGVRAGAVTGMSLDADPGLNGHPRAKVKVRLTNEAIALLNPREWLIAVTSSPLPGFKAEVDVVRHEGEPLPPLPDGAWHTDVKSAVTKQIDLAFDALVHKVRELSGTTGGEGGGTFSLRDLFKHPDGEDGDPALVSWMLNKEQVGLLTSVMKNMDSLTGTALEHQREGGLAQAALGSIAHDNLLKMTDELTKTVNSLHANLEKGGGNLLGLVLSKDDAERVSDTLKSVNTLAGTAAAHQEQGGLARAALGAEMHANLKQMTDDLTTTVNRLRSDLDKSGNLLQLVLAKDDAQRVSSVLKNVDTISGVAVAQQEQGGLARAALGADAYGNVTQLTDDLAKTVNRLRTDLEKSGNLLQLVMARDDAARISDIIKNIDALTGVAVGHQEQGGLAQAALGQAGHANLLQLTEDLTKMVNRVSRDLNDGGNLLKVLLSEGDSQTISDMLRKFDSLAGTAVESQREGGLAHTALGPTGHANLLKLTEDAASIADRVRADLEADGTLLQLLFNREDSEKISDLIGNVDKLSQRVAAVDTGPFQAWMDSLDKIRLALEDASEMVVRLVGPQADGSRSALESELAELPIHLKSVYGAIEKASRSTDEIMDVTAEVLRKANLTVSSINQILAGLKRSWMFRGAFNESLRYEDLAPYLVPSGTPGTGSGEKYDIDELLQTLDGGE